MQRSNRRAPVPLHQALSNLLRSLGIEQKVLRARVVVDWPELVGERVARVSEALKVDGTTLYVRVASDAWRNELQLMKREILDKIRDRYGEQLVREIRFV